MLTVTAASGSAVDRDRLIARITGARKLPARQVDAAVAELAAAAGIDLTSARRYVHAILSEDAQPAPA